MLGGFDYYDDKGLGRLADLAVAAIDRYQPDKIISGMARGWETGVALAALRTSVPLIAIILFKGLERLWSPKQQTIFYETLAKAHEVIILSKEPASYLVMQQKNEFMVMWCDMLLALWNGSLGDTYNIILYAQVQKKPVINL